MALFTRPSPEVPAGKMGSRPFRKLKGGNQPDDGFSYSGTPYRQVASSTPEMQPRAGKVNPLQGSGQDAEKVANYDEGTTQQDSGPAAKYLGAGDKTHGRTMNVGRAAALRARKKMRAAFGQGGMAMPQQSNQVSGPADGAFSGGQAPPSYAGRRGPNWKAGVNPGLHTKGTPKRANVAPGHR